MAPDIIEAPACNALIRRLIEDEAAPQGPWRTWTRRLLGEIMAAEGALRPARLRRTDPPWAHAKAAAGARLHRFWPERVDERGLRSVVRLIRFCEDVLEWRGLEEFQLRLMLGLVSELPDVGPLRAAAASGARTTLGRAERRGDVRLADIDEALAALLAAMPPCPFEADPWDGMWGERWDDERLAARLRPDAALCRAGLTAELCTSLNAVRLLGEEARNCLAEPSNLWLEMEAGETDYWAIRDGHVLVAVAAMCCGTGEVTALRGPGNDVLPEELRKAAEEVARAAGAASKRLHRGRRRGTGG